MILSGVWLLVFIVLHVYGFKFAPVIGEILADLTTQGATGHDISRFRLSRFG